MARRERKMNDGPKVTKEKEVVKKMIAIYCKRKHRQKDALCGECQDLLAYAHRRLSYCKFGEKKTACSNCLIHCYKPVYREKIKKVMRYSGKWMLLFHPFYSVRHLLDK